jgi:transcriptional regulator with XRE-family HTH domain
VTQESPSKQAVPIEKIGLLIKEKRKAEELTLEDISTETGVSISTLSRIERQFTGTKIEKATVPDTRTLTALTRWLGVPLEVQDTEAAQQVKNTPDILEVYLRADPRLNSKAAEALGNMFRVAYEQVAKSLDEDPANSRDAT